MTTMIRKYATLREARKAARKYLEYCIEAGVCAPAQYILRRNGDTEVLRIVGGKIEPSKTAGWVTFGAIVSAGDCPCIVDNG